MRRPKKTRFADEMSEMGERYGEIRGGKVLQRCVHIITAMPEQA